MIVDAPVVAVPLLAPNRPPPVSRPGGGGTAVMTESPRPLYDTEETEETRRNEERSNTDNRPGRSDVDLAALARFDIALGQRSRDDHAI